MTTPTHTNTAIDTINAVELRQLIDDDPAIRLVDVRTGAEFESLHVPGSFNIPLDTLDAHAKDLADADHPVVLVCRSGARATQGCAKLNDAGTHRLHLLDGGIDAWRTAGGDVVRGERSVWALDRQVRLVAGSLSLIGIVLSIFVPRAKWLAGTVAGGLTFSAVSDTCAMGNALARLRYNRTDNCDIDKLLASMEGTNQ